MVSRLSAVTLSGVETFLERRKMMTPNTTMSIRAVTTEIRIMLVLAAVISALGVPANAIPITVLVLSVIGRYTT